MPSVLSPQRCRILLRGKCWNGSRCFDAGSFCMRRNVLLFRRAAGLDPAQQNIWLNSGFTARCTLKCAGRKALPICALAAGKIKQGGKKPAGRTSLSEAKSATIKRLVFLQSGRVSLREPRHRLRHPPRRFWRKKASCALRESFLPKAHFRYTSAVKPGIQLPTSPQETAVSDTIRNPKDSSLSFARLLDFMGQFRV